MNLAHPEWLGALALVIALATVVALFSRWHQNALQRAFAGATFDKVLPASVRARRTVRDALRLGGLSLALVALADPRYGEKVWRSTRQQGVDLVIALDLSMSMDANDVQPSRLERARREIADLTELVDGDRIGLVIFAGASYARLPLTEDTEILLTTVEESDTTTFQAQGSDLGGAIRMGMKLLEHRRGTADRAILIMSDGEIHDPADALTAAREAREADVRVFAMGIGDAPSTIPTNGGAVLVHDGQRVISTPSSAVLSDIARLTGGAYVQSVPSADDMEQLYRDEIRPRMNGGDESRLVVARTSETAFQVPLALGAAMLLLGAWIGDGKRAFAAAAGLLLAIGMFGSPSAMAGTMADADALYRAGRFPDAVKAYTELSMDEPANPEVWDRLGAAQYRAGNYDGAARSWQIEESLGGADQQTAYDLGNANYRAHRLEEAVRWYDTALGRNPGDAKAAANKKLVEQEIEARRQNQPKKDPQGGSGGSASGGGSQEEGSPSDSNGQGEPGDPQQKPGEKPEDQQGDPKGGDSQESGQNPSSESHSPSDTQGGDGNRDSGDRTASDPSGQAAPGDLQGEPNGSATGAPTPGNGAPGAMSGEQAERMLDAVEEGRPRSVVTDRGETAQPW